MTKAKTASVELYFYKETKHTYVYKTEQQHAAVSSIYINKDVIDFLSEANGVNADTVTITIQVGDK